MYVTHSTLPTYTPGEIHQTTHDESGLLANQNKALIMDIVMNSGEH